jgi:two-component system, OmpR family, KDP operon response regulator KdpE
MREFKARPTIARRLAPPGFSSEAGRLIVASRNARQRAQLQTALELQGHQVATAETVDQTLQKTGSGLYHMLLLDSGFEGIEPYELCRKIRLRADLGIILLAGCDTTQGRIDALNAGADDYLPSPFILRELLARVRAVLRRVKRPADEGLRIRLHDRTIDLQSHQIRGPGSRVSRLTPKEFYVLQCLVARANHAFTHQYLAETIWQRDAGGEIEYMYSVIGQLRRKLEPDPDNPRYILTERSVGYRFQMPPA